MNECFTAEPTSCSNGFELKYLLDKFGPYSGRYLAEYPFQWKKLVIEAIKDWGELDKARALTLLQRAYEKSTIVDYPGLSWDYSQSWFDNVSTKINNKPPTFNGVVLERDQYDERIPNTYHIDNLELSPTTDERINALPIEFARVCKTLFLISPELFIIDPYLNPCRKDFFEVLEEMLLVISKGRCQRIILIAREKEVISKNTISEIEHQLKALKRRAKLKPNCEIEYRLFNDTNSVSRMHGRFLLSIKGGIQFDPGFQKQSKSRKVDVSPIGISRHDELLKIYLEGVHDMLMSKSICI